MSNNIPWFIALTAFATAVFTIFLGRDAINRIILTLSGAAAGALALAFTEGTREWYHPIVVLLVGGVAAVIHHELPYRSPALAGFAAALPLAFLDTPAAAAAPLLLAAVFAGQAFDWYTRQPIDLDTLSRASQTVNTDGASSMANASPPPPQPTGHDVPEPVASARAVSTVTAVRPVEVTMGAVSEFTTIGATPRLLRSSDAKLPHAPTMTTTSHIYDGYEHEGYVLRAASHIGTKHMAGGGPRQDSIALSRTSDGRYIVAAVADGVGSAKHSAIGSEWASRTAIRLVVHRYDTTGEVSDGPHIARIASDMVERVATTLLGEGTDPNDFSTTLVLAMIDTTSGKVVVYRVGDSGASVRTPDGWRHCFEDTGDVEASTNALPAEEPQVERWFGEIADGECLMLMTDGVGDLVHHAPDVASAFHHLTAEPGTASEFSSIVGFQRQQAHDDQSAIGIWRTQAVS